MIVGCGLMAVRFVNGPRCLRLYYLTAALILNLLRGDVVCLSVDLGHSKGL